MGKNPSFQFYPSDWARDLDEHPLEIEGAWIRICCRLWWSETPGKLTKSLSRWSKSLGIHHLTCLKVFKYLSSNGIGNIEVTGELYTIVNRRMMRDWEIRVTRSMSGTLGGNPNFKKGKTNPYYEKDNITKLDKQKITPSSSSSSSPSTSKEKKKRTTMSDDIIFSDYHREYAVKKGFDNGQGEELFESFKDYHLKEGKPQLDWNAAWRYWVRNEIKFRGKPKKEAEKLW